ncbi:MAG: M14 family zinc carboxypeptidase [Woeseiaceae bacterium]|nr:M14 family zinc carboxypeptidase [Woeseiaceae bacterium]
MKRFYFGMAAAAALLLVACAETPRLTVPAGTTCDTGLFQVDDGFVGARRGACDVIADNRVRLHIVREDDKVRNPSPWYAFRLMGAESETVSVTLDYGDWKHRYVPKISRDGRTWSVAPEAMFTQPSENTLELSLKLSSEPVWIAGNPMLLPADYEVWARSLAHETDASLSIAGRSIKGLPIYRLESGADNEEVIFLTGHQHPPEIPGAIAMLEFLETLYAETELAAEFRDRFHIVSLPLLNPDGIIYGHWRHNLGGTDLNRDWGPFAEPETRVIKQTLDELDEQDKRVRMFMDFHATKDNRFYTQSEPTAPEGFSAEWLARSGARISNDYVFVNDPRPTSPTANGKNYMYKRYGIPSLTYEVGDETPEESNRDATRVFAEEFMRLWLETP